MRWSQSKTPVSLISTSKKDVYDTTKDDQKTIAALLDLCHSKHDMGWFIFSSNLIILPLCPDHNEDVIH